MEQLTQTDSQVNNISATLKGLLLPICNDISALGSCMDDMAKDTDTLASTLHKEFWTSFHPLRTNLTIMHDCLNEATATQLTTANVSATLCREVNPSITALREYATSISGHLTTRIKVAEKLVSTVEDLNSHLGHVTKTLLPCLDKKVSILASPHGTDNAAATNQAPPPAVVPPTPDAAETHAPPDD
jgi:hypothetical protein